MFVSDLFTGASDAIDRSITGKESNSVLIPYYRAGILYAADDTTERKPTAALTQMQGIRKQKQILYSALISTKESLTW